MDFFKSIHGDRSATAREFAAQTEVVVEVGAINGEVGGTTVATGKAHAIGIRRHLDHIGDAAVDGGQRSDFL